MEGDEVTDSETLDRPNPSDQLVIKPYLDWGAVWNKAMPLVVVLGSQLTWWAGIVAALALAAIGLPLTGLYVRRAEVHVTATEIGSVGMRGLRMRSRAEIGAVVTAPVKQSSLARRALRSLLVLDDTGRRIVHIDEAFWKQEDLRRIVERLAITPISPDRIVTRKEISKRYPRALSWHERHPWLTAWASILPALVAVHAILFIVRTVADL